MTDPQDKISDNDAMEPSSSVRRHSAVGNNTEIFGDYASQGDNAANMRTSMRSLHSTKTQVVADPQAVSRDFLL